MKSSHEIKIQEKCDHSTQMLLTITDSILVKSDDAHNTRVRLAIPQMGLEIAVDARDLALAVRNSAPDIFRFVF